MCVSPFRPTPITATLFHMGAHPYGGTGAYAYDGYIIYVIW